MTPKQFGLGLAAVLIGIVLLLLLPAVGGHTIGGWPTLPLVQWLLFLMFGIAGTVYAVFCRQREGEEVALQLEGEEPEQEGQ